MITNKKLESAFNVVVKYGFCGECRWKFDGKDCHKCDCYENGVKLIRAALEKRKDADELEQSERVVHGHWEYVDTHLLLTYHRCSECGNVTDDYIVNKQTFQHDKLYYCPNCGAKMDEHFPEVRKKVDEVSE